MNQKSTIDLAQSLETTLSTLVHRSISLEKENAMLKRCIRILASGHALDENGNTTVSYSPQQVDFIKYVCDNTDTFKEGDTE